MNEKALQRLEYGKIKEMLSGYAVSYLGKKQAGQLMPLSNGKIVRKTLDETAEAKALLQHGASVPIPSLEGIEHILSLLGTGYVFSEQDFSHIRQFLTSCSQLMRYMAAKREAAPHVNAYAASMYEVEKLKSEIDRCIRNGQVTDAASKELQRVRKRIAVFEERLKSKLDSLMSKHRSILQEPILGTRNGRYVLPVKKEHRKLIKGTVLDESASGQTVYMEPAEVVSLQFELSGLKAEEAREEMKVLSDLTALAEEHAQQIEINAETVGVYDFLFAKAKYALAIDGRNVELNDEGIIELSGARHPLLGKQMVPLDFSIGRAFSSLIITGPNTGGKTLALKTVGLLTVMVQSGLLVPVQEGSLFSVYTNIAVDIGDGQSIEHALSTFSAHIRNVIDILRIADRSTLVLIDEMASGTDPGEGVGLSVAILEELYRRKSTVVATTHFTEIKNFAAATPGFENARMEFDADTLQPLYRLRIGEAGQSYAFLIALKLGIPADIISRSREITAGGLPHGLRNEAAAAPAGGGSGSRQDWAAAEGRAGNDGDGCAAAEGSTAAGAAEAYAAASSGDHHEAAETADGGTAGAAAERRRDRADGGPRQVGAAAQPAQRVQAAATGPAEAAPERAASFRLGDRVYVAYLDRSGIVYETEDAKGLVGVMIQKQKLKINKKRLKLQIESKELYPDNYDFDIIFETKENRKVRKLMNRKHVKGLIIESKPEE